MSKVTLKTLCIMLSLLLTGCVNSLNLNDSLEPEIALTKYYLWLKSIEKEAISTEISYQKAQPQNNQEASLRLLMLYSLPSSPIHNPYKAKSMLNDPTFSQFINEHLTVHDLAFISQLRDQLNQQLLHLGAIDKQKKVFAQRQSKLQLKLTMHQQAIKSLESKIAQLKTIEAEISKRENEQ